MIKKQIENELINIRCNPNVSIDELKLKYEELAISHLAIFANHFNLFKFQNEFSLMFRSIINRVDSQIELNKDSISKIRDNVYFIDRNLKDFNKKLDKTLRALKAENNKLKKSSETKVSNGKTIKRFRNKNINMKGKKNAS